MIKEKFLSAVKTGFGFCSVTFGWDMHDSACKFSRCSRRRQPHSLTRAREPDTKELKISNLANGYRDLIARIDLNTYRRTPGNPSLPFFLITFIEPVTNESLCACPRGTLQRVISEVTAEGLEAYAGAEVSALTNDKAMS